CFDVVELAGLDALGNLCQPIRPPPRPFGPVRRVETLVKREVRREIELPRALLFADRDQQPPQLDGRPTAFAEADRRLLQECSQLLQTFLRKIVVPTRVRLAWEALVYRDRE